MSTAYELGQVRLQVLHFGVNDTYLLSGEDGLAVLRVYRASRWTSDEVDAELRHLLDLDRRGVPVAVARPTRSGDLHLVVAAPEGPRCLALFDHIAGSPLDSTVDGAAGFGSAVGRLHRVGPETVSGRPAYDLDALVTRPLEVVRAAFAHRDDLWILEDLATAAHSKIASVDPVTLPRGSLHGDLQEKNALRRPDGQIVLFDFDECGSGYLVDDIAVFVMVARGRGDHASTEAFFRAYETERELGPAERDLLDSFVIARHVWAMSWQLTMAARWGPATWLSDDWFDWHIRAMRGDSPADDAVVQ